MSRDPVTVAVCSRTFSQHPVLRERLLARVDSVRFNDSGSALRGDALVAFLRGARKAIVALEPVDATLLDAVPELRVVSKFGVGLDAIDLRALAERGVELGWTPGVNRTAVAELTVSFAIQLLRGSSSVWDSPRAGQWRPAVGRELRDVTFGILGCGHVGREVARLVRAFGARVIAHDLVRQPEFCAAHGVREVSLTELLSEADVLSVHLPLDASTRRLLDGPCLDRLRRGAVVINTARGGIVDEDALADRLGDGRIAAAALDVFEQEPPPPSRLLASPNLVTTPHIGGSTERGILAMGEAAIEGLHKHRAALDFLGPARTVGAP
jgi:D-3-phosphoglycerate dehydrogenase